MGLFLPESKENGMFGASFLKKKKFTSQFTFPKENQLIERFGKDLHPTESTAALWAFCPVEGHCAVAKTLVPGMQGCQAGQTHKAFWAGLFSYPSVR